MPPALKTSNISSHVVSRTTFSLLSSSASIKRTLLISAFKAFSVNVVEPIVTPAEPTVNPPANHSLPFQSNVRALLAPSTVPLPTIST